MKATLIGGPHDGITLNVHMPKVEIPRLAPHSKGDWQASVYERSAAGVYLYKRNVKVARPPMRFKSWTSRDVEIKDEH